MGRFVSLLGAIVTSPSHNTTGTMGAMACGESAGVAYRKLTHKAKISGEARINTRSPTQNESSELRPGQSPPSITTPRQPTSCHGGRRSSGTLTPLLAG